ncbi:hypothetical protein FOL47_001995 [Perkinsus chesapeaki]|uniref:ATP synthase mitochondrial F1 complex assembly factor 2 n=1 Tax=Perkinsus chesapeaki TaxID=330153 RepID=A0A7J6MG04_PERCH|nr:hypothetical protein FOL47_001995 [Perkinsus chesapeaki]
MHPQVEDDDASALIERTLARGGALVAANICIFLDAGEIENMLKSSTLIEELMWEGMPPGSRWKQQGRNHLACFWSMHLRSSDLCSSSSSRGYLSPMLWSLRLDGQIDEPLRMALASPMVTRSLRRLEVDCRIVNIEPLLLNFGKCNLEELRLENINNFDVVKPLLKTSLKKITLSAARDCSPGQLEFPCGMDSLRDLQLISDRKGLCHIPARSLRNVLEAAQHLRWCSLAGATTDNNEDLICALFLLHSLKDLQLFDISFNPSRGWGMDPYRLYQLRRKLYPMFPIFCANEEASSICVCRGGLGSAPVERLRESYLTCLWSRAGWTPERLACCEVGIDKLECRECEEILNWYSSSNVVGTVSHVVERAVCGRAPPPTVKRLMSLRPSRRLLAALPSNTARMQKRFYDVVKVARTDGDAGWTVLLDGKHLSTPAKRHLVLPSEGLAYAVAEEWDRQDRFVRPHYMPLMALAATTIDLTMEDMEGVVERNLHYLNTDMTCYGEYPEWIKYRKYVSEKFNCTIASCKGISLPKHSEGADAALRAYLSTLSPWQLTAFDEMTRSAKSVIIALNYYLGNAPLNEACRASVLEELDNRGKWGTVEGDHDVSDRTLKMAMAASKFFAEESQAD